MYEASGWAVLIFSLFVLLVLYISWYFARRTRSSKAYFAAGGQIHWSVNGVAFAGDYLSAASFLGICGMIAVYGYDGFLYSIGYLAGWIVALFVVAEPMKRLGKYTFTDALDSTFNSKSIQLMAGISTLVVSMFYLIPQMVGAGALVTPLLGMPHWLGVTMVGGIVIVIVATAGMASTTYVQFLKGGLLIIFSITLVIVTLSHGLHEDPTMDDESPYHKFQKIPVTLNNGDIELPADSEYVITRDEKVNADLRLVKMTNDGEPSWWRLMVQDNGPVLREAYWVTSLAQPMTDQDGNSVSTLYNGIPVTQTKPLQAGHIEKLVIDGEPRESVRNLGFASFLSAIKSSDIARFLKYPAGKAGLEDGPNRVWVYYQEITPGREIMAPGLRFKVDSDKGATGLDKLNFASLMLALFCGTASLPHILIRYYTVPTPAAARKSTIVAIAAIGLFYLLTLFMGLGAMVNGVVDLTSNNMSAPLLARSFGTVLFAIISAIAFATVLGTVSGLIVASSGAVARDLLNQFLSLDMSDKQQVNAGKLAAIGVGIIAIALGIAFKGMNVSYLVGWAFAVAASANLPAIIMLLFWKRTTKQGIAASVLVGMVLAVGLILLSPDMFARYGLERGDAPLGLNNPGIISIPVSFLTLVVVSLLTQKTGRATANAHGNNDDDA